MSYRPRSRSPEYRQRRYSPSRPLSRSPPPPPRRYDDAPRRYDDHSPPPSRSYLPPPPSRYDDYPPPPLRCVDDNYHPPRARARYEDEPPPRARDRYEDDRTMARGMREESGGRGGMAADREEVRARDMPKREVAKVAEPAWERGRDAEELAVRLPTIRTRLSAKR